MLVSIVIPCYNVEAYVADALQSALAQTYRPIEIIAIDNNSTDRTKEILLDYQMRFPELITVLEEKKQGAPAARNLGLKQAKGEWVQFLDADDILLPEKIFKQVFLVGDGIGYIAGAAIFNYLTREKYFMKPLNDPIKGTMEGIRSGGTSSNLWSKKVLVSINGWDETLRHAQDTELMMRIISYGFSVVNSNDYTTIKRERKTGQISKGNPKINLTTQIKVRKNIINFLKINKSVYFKENKRFLFSALFYYIRILAGFDSNKARAYYEQLIPRNFILFPNRVLHIGVLYALLFNVMGFNCLESIRNFFHQRLNGRMKSIIRRIVHFS